MAYNYENEIYHFFKFILKKSNADSKLKLQTAWFISKSFNSKLRNKNNYILTLMLMQWYYCILYSYNFHRKLGNRKTQFKG